MAVIANVLMSILLDERGPCHGSGQRPLSLVPPAPAKSTRAHRTRIATVRQGSDPASRNGRAGVRNRTRRCHVRWAHRGFMMTSFAGICQNRPMFTRERGTTNHANHRYDEEEQQAWN